MQGNKLILRVSPDISGTPCSMPCSFLISANLHVLQFLMYHNNLLMMLSLRKFLLYCKYLVIIQLLHFFFKKKVNFSLFKVKCFIMNKLNYKKLALIFKKRKILILLNMHLVKLNKLQTNCVPKYRFFYLYNIFLLSKSMLPLIWSGETICKYLFCACLSPSMKRFPPLLKK